MSSKKNFILRIDEDTFTMVEKWAADDFRSVNGQIEFLLHQALIKSGRKKGNQISKEKQVKSKK